MSAGSGSGFEWAVVEPQRGQFRWDAIDRVIDEADSSCLSVLAMVGTTPQWARAAGLPVAVVPAARPRRLRPRSCGRWPSATRARSPRGRCGTSRTTPPGSAPPPIRCTTAGCSRRRPARCAPSTRTRPCCRRARAVAERQPGAGCSPTGSSIELYDTGALDAVDAIAYHPYSYPFLPSQRTGDNGFIDQLPVDARGRARPRDDDKKIWLTEFGSPTPAGDPTSLARQEQMVTDGFALWRSLDYVGPALLVRVA